MIGVAAPLKFNTGVKVTTPALSTVYVPSPATVKVLWMPAVAGSKSTVAASMVPSASVSFVVTLIVTGVSSVVVAGLLLATGASFTGLTIIEIVPVLDTNPLLSFTV